MQRLHENDLSGYLINKKDSPWEVLKLPAIISNTTYIPYEKQVANINRSNISNLSPTSFELFEGCKFKINENTPLHEDRENKETLSRIKAELGEYNFSAQYLQQPITNNGNMVKKCWLEYFDPENLSFFDKIIQSWDTAIKAQNEHDYSVGITIGVIKNKYYILDVVRKKTRISRSFV